MNQTDNDVGKKRRGEACAKCGRDAVVLIDGDFCAACRMDVIEEVKRRQRMIALYRIEDESGVSGEGLVATGIELPDGGVAIQWLNEENLSTETERNGWALYPSEHGVEDALEVHGHEGRTKVIVI